MASFLPLLPPPLGVERIGRRVRLARHRHDHRGFVAVVLSGGYQESGDAGRFDVGPGDALVHAPFEAHKDDLSASGALVLNLPLPRKAVWRARYRIDDGEALAWAAARDVSEAAALFLALARPCRRALEDWPDLLAGRLRSLAPFRLDEWAATHGLAPESVSRGFRKAFGVTPHLYRAEARGRRAIAAIRESERPLAAVAADLGFSDQAHMSRAVRALSGRTPGQWRRLRLNSPATP